MAVCTSSVIVAPADRCVRMANAAGAVTGDRRRREGWPQVADACQISAISLAALVSSSRNRGSAISMSAWARCCRVFPRISATPNSVTMLSTVFLDVVTTDPGVSVGRILDMVPPRAVDVEHDEALPALGVHGPAGEVVLSAAGGVILPAHGLGGALPVEVDLGGGVDRDEVGFPGDDPGVVHPVDRGEVNRRVLVQEVIQPLRAQGQGGDHLPAAELLPGAGDDTGLDQVDHPVGHQLGVHPQVAVVLQHAQQRVGHAADTGLDRGAVRDPLGHERGDRPVGVGDDRCVRLDQRVVDLGPADHLADVNLVSAERAGHLRVGFQEERCPPDQRRGVVAVGAQ